MPLFIHKVVRPSNLQAWIKTNAPSYLKAHPMDSWRAYLASLGGTGKTTGDLERSGNPSITGSGSTSKEKIRDTFK